MKLIVEPLREIVRTRLQPVPPGTFLDDGWLMQVGNDEDDPWLVMSGHVPLRGLGAAPYPQLTYEVFSLRGGLWCQVMHGSIVRAARVTAEEREHLRQFGCLPSQRGIALHAADEPVELFSELCDQAQAAIERDRPFQAQQLLARSQWIKQAWASVSRPTLAA